MEYYSTEQLWILNLIKDHLSNSILFTNITYKPKGGIYIKPKPKSVRLDVIEINMLGKIHSIQEEVIVMININIYHEDEGRTDQLYEVIRLLMDDAYLSFFYFKFGRAHLFQASNTLKMQNLMYRVTIGSKDYKRELSAIH